MPFVPEIPTHRQHHAFTYFADGMLGPFELMKWPQVFDSEYPHDCAAPANPDLPSPDMPNYTAMPQFEGLGVAWRAWDDFLFEQWSRTPRGAIGCLREPVVNRLRTAHSELAQRVLKIGADLPSQSKRPAGGEGLNGAQAFAAQLLVRSKTVHDVLAETPMTPNEVLQWFRESQRLLLELQAWVIFMEVIKPRIEDPNFVTPLVLPVRGVITEKILLANTMFRVGVPVWLVREAHTIGEKTAVKSAVRVTLHTIHMSDKRFMIHGDNYRKAPAWIDAPTLDAAMQGIRDQLRRFSLSSRPLVRVKVAFAEEDRQEAVCLPKDWSELGELTSTSGAGPSSGARGGGQQMRPVVEVKPEWLPRECGFLSRVMGEHPALTIMHPHKPQVYHVPPVHLFFSEGTTLGAKIHNWLRIRPWCIAQTITAPDGGAVLLTGTQWRIALEGRYHQICRPEKGGIQPRSSPDEIARLPPGPRAQKQARSSRPPDRRALRRTCDRIDINVRFGVTGGFQPYTENIQPTWGTQQVARADADVDKRIWAEVTWELAAMNFRLELMALDRLMNAAAYAEESEGGKDRELEIMLIWEGDGQVRPTWDRRNITCGIDAPTPAARRSAFTRWARVLNVWPPARGMLPETPPGTQEEFEAQIAGFYCNQFHLTWGRFPSLPHAAPTSLSRHY
ncbi:hypothetical protein FA95DRAFT_1613983 [Auriscalpium vulgare]|uniref:Uncharacterized protein n=1 Tax=Auriscalpium vulgare TaxID=40419 RepID=A0ACB8R119_9AGAM|nr:hypothetical protein FA95DRAFT_1613983 [Auriscalpium vulgare]